MTNPRVPAAGADEARRDCDAVTHFLRAGFPAVSVSGDTSARSAVRAASDHLGVNRQTFAQRVGTPDRPGSHHRRHGIQPDWQAAEKVAAERGELGFAPVLPGFVLAKTSRRYDKTGVFAGETVSQRKAPGEVFQVRSGLRVVGETALVDADGRVTSKYVLTREGKRSPQDLAEEIRAALLDVRGQAEIMEPVVVQDEDLLTVYIIPDLHLGMLAHKDECGENYDLKIAAAMVKREIARLMAMAPPSRNAVVLFLGDFFHQNDQRNATPRSGHALDVDGRWRRVYGVGARVAINVINAVAGRHEQVEVAFLPGNHDEDAALTLAVALELYFEDAERVTVSPGSGIHWFRRFGRCLLGASHGHTLKPDRMAWLLATDRPQDWGETEHRHFFFGHIHHATAQEIGPVRVESFTSPAAKDAYAAAGGYRSTRAFNAVTFHREEGEVSRHRVNIRGATAPETTVISDAEAAVKLPVAA